MAIKRVLSVEDGNLSNSSITSTKNRLYKDLDISFIKKPSGDVYTKTDAAAVKQAVINLITTNFYEKPFNPFFGADIVSMLFELADDETEGDIKNNIISSIEAYEPRAKIIEVKVDVADDLNSVNVTIEFNILNIQESVIVRTTLSRLR